jgi:hypothetical protein
MVNMVNGCDSEGCREGCVKKRVDQLVLQIIIVIFAASLESSLSITSLGKMNLFNNFRKCICCMSNNAPDGNIVTTYIFRVLPSTNHHINTVKIHITNGSYFSEVLFVVKRSIMSPVQNRPAS